MYNHLRFLCKVVLIKDVYFCNLFDMNRREYILHTKLYLYYHL